MSYVPNSFFNVTSQVAAHSGISFWNLFLPLLSASFHAKCILWFLHDQSMLLLTRVAQLEEETREMEGHKSDIEFGCG